MPPIAVLLDLDDTLLTSNTARFVQAYLKRLSKALRPFAPPDVLVDLILRATRAIQLNEDPAVTNRQAFERVFLPGLDGSPADVTATLAHFYRHEYPALRRYVSPRPEAPLVVRHLLQAGHRVVLATNPIFPRTAIEQRMQWAGVHAFPYALVTTMENMHACKPNPRYYREILATIACPPERALMVGDDPANDIAPAREVGLKTWWIAPEEASLPPALSADFHGSLAEFLDWVQDGGLPRLFGE